ncbi:hypothetical protein ITG08_18965 [Vibrio cyclitrophicus]|uniref:hypothetical protein n=1 Tax=Vibrio cyclitrophicus TaxID=47951 RepID=UPI0020570F80|nr:hypothetical protein [Vibrio cyclitrophicus]UPR28080.1 hypothetical protein ITG08_18765 [Vibrio cyclitrophicus]UPR28081.1 hypothetical protein ITG08_18770 [Vibrio cyclitrophicus]UPR28082.1 hypothetical protein ITG08_18775 [Vibrio cyclitrophicus]UPR28085.1 hypothetical protein ITG08_18790 [Vibrio cyclitrophicus]UPR28087.1 hypothetical protein ITG08_18800 [Vibrio cyclitrophicus]
MLSPSVGTGAVVVQFPSTRYSTVAPSSVPPTVKLPSLVKKSSAAEPESVSSVSVGASGAVVSRVNVSSLLPDVLPAASV